MALTHVCKWTGKKWERISADDAVKLYPYGTSVYRGLFMCELCGQYVSLISGTVQRSHFRHSSSEANKECKDRSTSFSWGYKLNSLITELPLRISILSDNSFELEIGFYCIDKKNISNNSQIEIYSEDKEDIYRYSISRIQEEGITYLSVGKLIRSLYLIEIHPNIKKLNNNWPNFVKGVSTKGTLFNKVTRKKLVEDSDVVVGVQYYLVVSHRIYGNEDVEIRKICSMFMGWFSWYVYEVEAKIYSEKAAKFFLDYHYRLTDEATTMYPIWPICIEKPYILEYKKRYMYFYFDGNVKIDIYPYREIKEFNNESHKAFEIINCKEQQLLTLGRMNVLEHKYLCEDSFDRENNVKYIDIVDIDGNILSDGIHVCKPKKNSIYIYSKVDGIIHILDNEILIREYKLKANEKFILNEIKYNQTIRIYQGLDCVWSCTYIQEKNNNLKLEIEIINKLNKCKGIDIKIPHYMGGLVDKIYEYSQIREWLYKCIREGKIKKDAINIVLRFIKDVEEG